VREHAISAADGRTLKVLEDGQPDGRAVFVLHGTPGARLLYGKHVTDARARGIRLIGYDRPGYGGSTRRPDRSVGDVAGDVAAIADALGIDRFGVWGHSGGGDPALACAALLPQRVVASACLAGQAPEGAPGIDPYEGLGELNAEDRRLLLSDRVAWERKGREEVAQMQQATPQQLVEYLRTLLSEVDVQALSPELTDFFWAQSREGLRGGADGILDDNLGDLRPWGFELSQIRVPLQIWHGRHDKFVPFQHGRWLAEHLPRAEAHLEPDEGHVSLFERRIPEVHAWILGKF
jgi:pimeloyl-ACP methyl ester carboxylesterase